MRHVSIAPTDEEALDAMTEDLDRLHRLGTGGPSDLDRARHTAKQMVADESFITGSPETVAKAIRCANDTLGIDVFLANIHAAGVSQQRLEYMVTLLAEDVAPRLRD
jgi:alkanesulfonate monooxygenase SsuD/methylene tetrahydromethanopterin reductase-like flavin-dependent oxidoreductase (luciferase family)